MRLCLLHALALSSLQAWALHKSDVGVIDWYKRLIGVPLVGSVETAPKFHHVGDDSLLLTATASNVLTALHPQNGSVAWRFLFDSEDRINSFYKNEAVITTLSGQGGATLRSFDVSTGHLVSERRLHPPSEGIGSQPQQFGNSVAYVVDKPDDLLVLTNGHKVSYIDGTTGGTGWTWAAPDQTSLILYTKLFSTPDAIYVIGVSKSITSYILHITTLSSTGQVLNEVDVPSKIVNPITDVVPLFSHVLHQYKPRIAWLEDGQIKSKALTPDLKHPLEEVKGLAFDRILDVGLGDYGYFVALKRDELAWIMKIEEGGTVVRPWREFDRIPHEAPKVLYGGGMDKEGKIYVARVLWSRRLKNAVVDIVSSAETQIQQFHFPFDILTHGSIVHVTVTLTPNPHLVVSTNTGAVQLWALPLDSGSNTQPGAELLWNREEGLSAISVSEFVELPEQVSTVSGKLGDEGYIGRLQRQLVAAQNLPHYLFNFVVRFATGSYPSSTTPPSIITSANATGLARDPFGFRQVIIAATELGKVYAIDTATGEIVWSRIFGLGWAGKAGKSGKVVGGRVDVIKVYVIKPVGSSVGKRKGKKMGLGTGEEVTRPEVVLVAQRTAHNTLVDTVLFHVDAMTGADVRSQGLKQSSDVHDLLQGLDVIQGPMIESFLLQNEARAVAMLDEFLQVYLYPNNDETKAMFTRVASSLSIPLTASVSDPKAGKARKRIVGHRVELNEDLSDKYIGYPSWTLSLPPDEHLRTLVPAAKGPVASLGKVLGNRTTLYKYLNQRLFGVLTEPTPDSKTRRCGLYVVDGVKGTIVYRVALPAVTGGDIKGAGCDVRMSLVENWLVYHYYDERGDGVNGTKGWRMVSAELYEGLVDQKTGSSDMSSYNENIRNVTVFEQAYVFPHAITAIATTSTKFGITTKDIIVATHNNKIQTIPRRLLDPRRPKRKPNAEEQEEMLIEYDPVVPDEPKQVVSHNYETAQIRHITTSPALLESTSLVFAYGLDLFLTRVSPSGTFDVLSESFNKAQLVLTVMGLVVAIVVTRPMVKRKVLRQKWYR
ncbi:hypothetical protein AX15_005151 [Amanita polypyramis BW_CC]|nr:hypothetical protein AX15_005151 [Amanita polypyramis BW_CC]